MTNEAKDRRFVELVHALTQRDQVITITNDFQGMLNVTVGDRSHQHLGCPYGDMKDLERMLRNYLAECLEEMTTAERDNAP